jgi:hypothetical protein
MFNLINGWYNMTKEKSMNEEVTKRLDVIIYLLLKKNQDMNIRQMIAELKNAGLDSSEIAGILHKKPGFVSKELSLLKKSKNKSSEGAENVR